MAERGASRLPSLPAKRGRGGRGAAVATKFAVKRVLVVDVGGNSVKILASRQKVQRPFPSGLKVTPMLLASVVTYLVLMCSCDVLTRLSAALEPDETVIGGGNVGKLGALPPHARAGDNANAFRGGFLLWQDRKRNTAAGSKRRFG